MNAPFSALFEPLEGCKMRETKGHSLRDRMVYSSCNPIFYDWRKGTSFVRYVKDVGIGGWLSSFLDFDKAEDYSMFRPLPNIQERIDSILEEWDIENVVGVHIRRSDNVNAIAYSPIELFERRINAEIKSNADVKFFLASDDAEVKEYLANKFHDRILTLDVAERSAENGVHDAVVDLFLLASTSKIYGSYWSSFSEVAAHIGKKPLEVLSTVENDAII